MRHRILNSNAHPAYLFFTFRMVRGAVLFLVFQCVVFLNYWCLCFLVYMLQLRIVRYASLLENSMHHGNIENWITELNTMKMLAALYNNISILQFTQDSVQFGGRIHMWIIRLTLWSWYRTQTLNFFNQIHCILQYKGCCPLLVMEEDKKKTHKALIVSFVYGVKYICYMIISFHMHIYIGKVTELTSCDA